MGIDFSHKPTGTFEVVLQGRFDNGMLTGKRGSVSSDNPEDMEKAIYLYHGPKLARQEIPDPEVLVQKK